MLLCKVYKVGKKSKQAVKHKGRQFCKYPIMCIEDTHNVKRLTMSINWRKGKSIELLEGFCFVREIVKLLVIVNSDNVCAGGSRATTKIILKSYVTS